MTYGKFITDYYWLQHSFIYRAYFIHNSFTLLRLLWVTYFDQLLLAARQVHVVYLDQLLGAAHYIHFISNHDNLCK